MRKMALLALTLLFLTQISAFCEEGQIDINSASVEELDSITQIGPARAQEMITLRPFSSVEDMIRINGIGETNIKTIKSQGLACVDDEEIDGGENEETSFNETNAEDNNTATDFTITKTENPSPKETELKTIDLSSPDSPKAIKSDGDSKVSGKRNPAIYGLFAFGVLLGLLFLIKNLIKRKKISK